MSPPEPPEPPGPPGPPDGDPRVVPAYALTGGRTRSVGDDLPWETLATSTRLGQASLSRLRFERARIVANCRQPRSLAEVAADLGVPLGVARVLVSDLCADGLLVASRPVLDANGRPRVEILERLLDGLKART